MSIENSFCLCDWQKTCQLWTDSATEEDFTQAFFTIPDATEISFTDSMHYQMASWELLEDFSDWYRGRALAECADWHHFCSAWKALGLMEVREFHFGPINDLPETQKETEVVFGALCPDSVKSVVGDLDKIQGDSLDQFFEQHELAVTVPFSAQVAAWLEHLVPSRGLVIFAG